MDHDWMGRCGQIITNGAINIQEYYSLFQDGNRAQQLLMGNVFALQHGRNMVTFDCKIGEEFARKKLEFRSDNFRSRPPRWLGQVRRRLFRSLGTVGESMYRGASLYAGYS